MVVPLNIQIRSIDRCYSWQWIRFIRVDFVSNSTIVLSCLNGKSFVFLVYWWILDDNNWCAYSRPISAIQYDKWLKDQSNLLNKRTTNAMKMKVKKEWNSINIRTNSIWNIIIVDAFNNVIRYTIYKVVIGSKIHHIVHSMNWE